MQEAQTTQTVKEQYRFVLYLNDEVITESGFPSDVYKTRFVNIRELAPELIKMLQQTLSLQNVTTKINGYDLIAEYQKALKPYKGSVKSKLERVSEGEFINDKGEVLHKVRNGSTYFTKEGEKAYFSNKAEQFKFVLFLGDNSVIERNFFVKRYNPKTRFSLELNETISDVVSLLKNQFKIIDSNYLIDQFNGKSYSKEFVTNLGDN
jgi:hypothetical protein